MRVLTYLFVTVSIVGSLGGPKNQPACPHLKLRFGRVKYRQRGRIARFICNTGYMLAGDRYSVCVQGHWDNTFPKCVRATCPSAKPPVNGLIYPSHGGAVLNFYCKSNFELRGPNITYCDGDRWDNPLPTCLPTNSTPSLSCDFETEDLCGWNHDLNHDFDWTRMSFDTPSGSIGTGPSHDHTKGAGQDGYYMYIESSARNVNDTARLISPIYDRSDDNICFQFYYHMYGVTTGDLRLYLKKINQTWDLAPAKAIFAKNGNQGNRWFRGFVELGPVNEDFQIVIEGVRGSSYVSDIAIDDVRLVRNCNPEAELVTSTAEPTSSEQPITVESCEGRCNTTDTQSSEWLITCDCDDTCFGKNRCCPDYFDYCIFGTSLDDFVDETTSTVMETSTAPPTTTQETAPPTTITVKKEQSKIIYVKPDDVADVPMMTLPPEEIETPAPPVKEIETETVDGYGSDKSVNQKIVVAPKIAESNTKTVVFAVGVVFGVLFGVVGMAFVAKRYRLYPCRSLRRLNQSSNGDSQSDVRFLTSDEALDFSLPRDYDSL